MIKKSLQHNILINIAAFVFVFILEVLSLWTIKDVLDTDFPIFFHSFNYSVIVMIVIWINHFILIPFLFDKRRYAIYGILLVGSIFIGSYLWAFSNWIGVSKMFFYLIYTTGTGMAAFLLRRNLLLRRDRDEKENLQKVMELNYLKAQVNPHFLFNSLNSIYSLSRKQSLETPDLVIQLSELMRYQLESAKKDTVLLKEELEFIENYLFLEEKRLSKRCAIEFVIEGDALNLKISPMLLIPFVENAVKHGAQSTNEQSTIDISCLLYTSPSPRD